MNPVPISDNSLPAAKIQTLKLKFSIRDIQFAQFVDYNAVKFGDRTPWGYRAPPILSAVSTAFHHKDRV